MWWLARLNGCVGETCVRPSPSIAEFSVVKIRRRKRTLSPMGVDAPLQPMTDKATSLEIYQRLGMGSFPFCQLHEYFSATARLTS